MKLPNAAAARVDFEKLTEYLLSETHPIGRTKAAFFQRLGFARDRPEELLAAGRQPRKVIRNQSHRFSMSQDERRIKSNRGMSNCCAVKMHTH